MEINGQQDVITCKECNAENAKTRVTCQVCHKPLYITTKEKRSPQSSAEKTTEIPATKKDRQTSKEKRLAEQKKEIKPSEIVEDLFPEPPETVPIVPDEVVPTKKRKPRSKKPAKRGRKSRSEGPEMFLLEDGKLVPVEVTLRVRPFKRVDVKSKPGRFLLDLWSHNRSLAK